MPLPEGAYYLYQSFLVQLEHRASAAAPFGGVRGNAPEQVGGFLLCFGDDLGGKGFPLKFCSHQILQPSNIRKYNILAIVNELACSRRIRTNLPGDRVADWNRISISGMYMIQILFRNRKHILN